MINLLWTLKIAIKALQSNKMRSALTMLGVIIGVGAVIAMLAVGTGASQRISQQYPEHRQQPADHHARLDDIRRRPDGGRHAAHADPGGRDSH